MSLTVLMTTYNCAPYISQAIKSILNQTYKDFEFLIIDDGSSDSTEQAVGKFKDKRIRYIKRDHFGRAASLNYGLRNSSNNVIALMDADDISHPERIEKQLKIYSGEVNEVVFTRAAYFKDRKILFKGDLTFTEEIFKRKLALHGPYNNSTVLFNRSLILSNVGYDESLIVGEDHDLWLRLMDQIKIKHIDDLLYFIRLRDSSLSYFHFSNTKDVTYHILERYYKNLISNFKLNSHEEEIKLKGWREFFYGSVVKMRQEWGSIKFRFWDLRMLTTYLLSFFPEKLLITIKNWRVRWRLQYYLKRITNNDELQQAFNKLLKSI